MKRDQDFGGLTCVTNRFGKEFAKFLRGATHEAWHTAEPDKGRDATAAEWKAKLPPAESSAEPSDQK